MNQTHPRTALLLHGIVAELQKKIDAGELEARLAKDAEATKIGDRLAWALAPAKHSNKGPEHGPAAMAILDSIAARSRELADGLAAAGVEGHAERIRELVSLAEDGAEHARSAWDAELHQWVYLRALHAAIRGRVDLAVSAVEPSGVILGDRALFDWFDSHDPALDSQPWSSLLRPDDPQTSEFLFNLGESAALVGDLWRMLDRPEGGIVEAVAELIDLGTRLQEDLDRANATIDAMLNHGFRTLVEVEAAAVEGAEVEGAEVEAVTIGPRDARFARPEVVPEFKVAEGRAHHYGSDAAELLGRFTAPPSGDSRPIEGWPVDEDERQRFGDRAAGFLARLRRARGCGFLGLRVVYRDLASLLKCSTLTAYNTISALRIAGAVEVLPLIDEHRKIIGHAVVRPADAEDLRREMNDGDRVGALISELAEEMRQRPAFLTKTQREIVSKGKP